MIRGSVIGLAGYRRSGKSTIADTLAEHDWLHDSFAAPIRQSMCLILGIEMRDLEAVKEEPQRVLGGCTPREIMQMFGTEWMRGHCGPDVWVLALDARIKPFLRAGRNIVISDVRFANEAEYIRSIGGEVVWVEREGCGPSEHRSEQGLPPHLIDHRVENDGDLARLRTLARILASVL